MAISEQFNIKPLFKTDQVPCDGLAGDLLVITPLEPDERDTSPQGVASLWFCTKSSDEKEQQPAIWARVQFDGIATCKTPPVPKPPQNKPVLERG